MSGLSLAHCDDLTLAQHTQLNLWYRLNHAEHSELTEQIVAPALDTGMTVVVFGFNLGNAAQQVNAFLCQNQAAPYAFCRYQAHEDLPPAYAFFCHHVPASFATQVRHFSEQHSFQVACLQNPPRISEQGLLVMDMDSTAITIECIDEIARLGGVYDEVAAITAKAMAGELDFSQSLKQRVAKLNGIPLTLIDDFKAKLPFMPGIELLCATLKQHHWHLAIASGGFVPFAEQVQQQLNLDRICANQLVDNGKSLTGQITGNIVDSQAKAEFLTHYRDELQLSQHQTLAMGDGANDLPMLATAGLGVAVHGKPKVVAAADAAINAGSVAQILYFLTVPH